MSLSLVAKLRVNVLVKETLPERHEMALSVRVSHLHINLEQVLSIMLEKQLEKIHFANLVELNLVHKDSIHPEELEVALEELSHGRVSLKLLSLL